MKVDLCASLGAGYGPYMLGEDEAMLEVVSSVHIACGLHAGDPVIMDRTVRRALARKIDIGAHVGFPDLLGFGRRQMDMHPQDVARYVAYQMGALEGITKSAGGKMSQVALHGALENMAAVSPALADAIVNIIAAYDRNLVVRVTTNSEVERAAKRLDLRTVMTFLPERAYDDDGRLVPRSEEGARIGAHATVLDRVRQFMDDRSITSISGRKLYLNADSIFLRSDSPSVANLARSVRGTIELGGGRIAPVSER
jgi:UPF0271 protein